MPFFNLVSLSLFLQLGIAIHPSSGDDDCVDDDVAFFDSVRSDDPLSSRFRLSLSLYPSLCLSLLSSFSFGRAVGHRVEWIVVMQAAVVDWDDMV